MSEHVLKLLGAHHDGELRGRRLAQVQEHLADCETCCAEMDKLQALTNLLASPLPTDLLSPPERFVAQVALRMPHQPTQSGWQRALERGWQMVPLGLWGTWAVAQAVFIMVTATILAWRMGLGENVAAGWLPAWQSEPGLAETLSLSGASLRDVASLAWRLFSSGGPLGWGFVLYLGMLYVIGVLYCGWLASWWAYQQHCQHLVEQSAK